MQRPPFHSTEQSLRSVFVGNISYTSTEEQLTEVFSTVGPVVKFRLVRDRDTGKPKGFGFCEYSDIQTAEAAIRNLNNFELHGRSLKVDSSVNSASDKHTQEDFLTQTCMVEGGPEVFEDEEPTFGPSVEPAKALETITHTVANFPAEKMFQVLKEMKELARTDPLMCKSLLDTNPQLGFALLQLLIIMRSIDTRDAVSMLHTEVPTLDYPFYKSSADDDSDPFSKTSHLPPADLKPLPHRTLLPRPSIPPNPYAATGHLPHPVGHPSSSMPSSSISQQMPKPSGPPPEPDESQVNENAQLLIQLLQLDENQIACLSEEDRNKVRELQQQLRGI